MTKSQLEALKAYIDAKTEEAIHYAIHRSASTEPAEEAWHWVELCFQSPDDC